MKQARLQVMDRFDWNCALCGEVAWCIHHCDNTNWNHSIDNLISLCQSCHILFYIHKIGKPSTSGITPPDWNDPIDVRRYYREYAKKFVRKESTQRTTGITPPDWKNKLDRKRYGKEYYQKFYQQEHPRPRGRPKIIKDLS